MADILPGPVVTPYIPDFFSKALPFKATITLKKDLAETIGH